MFSVLSQIVTLEMKSADLTTAPPTNLDADCQTYVESVLNNSEKDAIRSARQWINFRTNDEELVLESSGNPQLRPGTDCIIPLIPPGLALRRRGYSQTSKGLGLGRFQYHCRFLYT